MTHTTSYRDNAIGYRGRIKVQVRKANRTLATYNYTNAGLPNFFNGLCAFLAGQGDVKDILPASIALYSLDTSSPAFKESASYSWDSYWENGLPIQVSQLTVLDTIYTRTAANGTPSVVFQVSIPYHTFSGTQDIYLMALYPKRINTITPAKSALAFYELKNVTKSWSPLTVDNKQSDLNLLIEWQMDFMNQAG
jgi:hypothetical protein